MTSLAARVDGGVRRLQTAYNTQGLPSLFTQYGAAGGGTVVNQVQRACNGLGQLTTEWQAVSGAVNTGTTPKVQYAYTAMAGGANHSRPTSMTYPNGRVLRYEYNGGLDANIGRLSYLADQAVGGGVGTHLEELSYLGLGTVVARNHPEPGLNLTYVGAPNGDAGDKYVGLDRFGRVADQRWVDVGDPSTAADDRDADRFGYAYDRNSNRVSRDWTSFQMPSTGGFDEAYAYDSMDRLTRVNRGNLASGTIADAAATYSQQWDNTGGTGSGLDALGNWKGVTTDANGGVAGGATTQTRTHNAQNQIATIPGAAYAPTYDAAGSMTRDEAGTQYAYDAWNRTVKVKTAAGVDKVMYTVDALGRRAKQAVTSSGVGAPTDLYYSAGWQVLEEREAAGVKAQTVFSPVYVDAVVERDTFDLAGTAGATDPTFGTGGSGSYQFTLATGANLLRCVVLGDNKVVAVGEAGGNVYVVRLTAAGALDTTFNGTGYRMIDFGGTDLGQSVVVQPDGKIVVCGTNGSNAAFARLNANGTLDATFKGPSAVGAGFSHFDYGGGTYDSAVGVALQADGKIVFGGVAGGDFLVGRLNADGTRDATYGTTYGGGTITGVYKVDFGGADTGYEVALDAQERAVLAGETSTGGGLFAVARLTTAGMPDLPFGGANTGKVTTGVSGGADAGRGVEIDRLERIVVAGQAGGKFGVVRYLPTGALDSSFGTGGIVAENVSPTAVTDRAQDLAIDTRNRVVVGGHAGNDTNAGVMRLTEAGTPDLTFGAGGKVVLSLAAGTTGERLQEVVVQPTGQIVVVGQAGTNFAVTRLLGGDARHYLVQDANYNVTAVAAATGEVVDRYQYSAYGEWAGLNADFSPDSNANGEVYQAFYYQGLRFDGNSQNHHARNRDYRAALGRWGANDPLKEYKDGLNLYQFLQSDPINYVDPSGCGRVGKAIGQVVGGIAGAVGGAAVGGMIDGMIGAAAGSVVPVAGTAAGAVGGVGIGVVTGGVAGGAAGIATGGAVGDALGEWLSVSMTGSGGGGSANGSSSGGNSGGNSSANCPVKTTNANAPKAGNAKSTSDLPNDYKSWPSEPAGSGKGTLYRDPTNPGRTVREMNQVTHGGADPAKQGGGGYIRYTDGFGGVSKPIPR